MVSKNGEALTDVWKSSQELQQDIELVKSSFEQWHSQNKIDGNDTEFSPEDAAFESLCEHYDVSLASKKLDLILENCFKTSTYEDGGWVIG